MSACWWLRKRHYLLYVVREFTALPMALWLLWLLWDIQSAGAGPSGFQAPRGIDFVVFSAVCLAFAMYHSSPFLKLPGVITPLNLSDKPVPPGVIVFTMFGLWAVASIVIIALLIGLGR